MRNNFISVIVPIYNVEKYLKKCIESIINQTYKNLEIILVDDGSTDDSGKICDEYASKDTRIKVIHKVNGGQSSARNAGIDVCTSGGEFITFVDGDDYLAADMYEYLFNNKIEGGICCCGIADVSKYKIHDIKLHNDIVDLTGSDILEKYLDVQLEVYNNGKDQSLNLSTSFCNKLFSKKLFGKIRFPEGLLNEDNFIILDILNKAVKVRCLPENKYYYVKRLGSTTQKEFNLRSLDLPESRKTQEKQIAKYLPNSLWKSRVLTLLACINVLALLAAVDNRKNLKSDIGSLYQTVYERKDFINKLGLKYKIKLKLFLSFPELFFIIFHKKLKLTRIYKQIFYN